MHSTTVFSILAVATLALAAPAAESKRTPECPGSGAYYVCAKNGFRGYCSSDPCDKTWCPDFAPWTCTRTGAPTPDPTEPTKEPIKEAPVTTTPCSGSGAWYVCANNGFKGACSVDPCALSWCPDYQEKTCTKVASTIPDRSKPFYVCYNNGFRGECSVDPCAISWCPDYKTGTYEPVGSATVPTPVPTTTPITTVIPTASPAPVLAPGTCAPGTGYYQVCASGFKGCCKKDACALGYCPAE